MVRRSSPGHQLVPGFSFRLRAEPQGSRNSHRVEFDDADIPVRHVIFSSLGSVSRLTRPVGNPLSRSLVAAWPRSARLRRASLRLRSFPEATERLVGSPVFKTGGGSKGPRRVRFPSASANAAAASAVPNAISPPAASLLLRRVRFPSASAIAAAALPCPMPSPRRQLSLLLRRVRFPVRLRYYGFASGQ